MSLWSWGSPLDPPGCLRPTSPPARQSASQHALDPSTHSVARARASASPKLNACMLYSTQRWALRSEQLKPRGHVATSCLPSRHRKAATLTDSCAERHCKISAAGRSVKR